MSAGLERAPLTAVTAAATTSSPSSPSSPGSPPTPLPHGFTDSPPRASAHDARARTPSLPIATPDATASSLDSPPRRESAGAAPDSRRRSLLEPSSTTSERPSCSFANRREGPRSSAPGSPCDGGEAARDWPGSGEKQAGRGLDALHESEKWLRVQSSSKRSPSPEFIVTPVLFPDDENDNDNEHKDVVAPSPREILRALAFLSTCAAPLSIGIAFYAIACLIWVLIASPLRLCARGRTTLSRHTAALLIPPLLLQYRCITGPSSRPSSHGAAASEPEKAQQTRGFETPFVPQTSRSVAFNLFAPLVAVPLMLASWVAAAAWGLSAMVASETTGGGNDDERAVARKTVGGWIRCLEWADVGGGEGDREWRRWWFKIGEGQRQWHGRGRRKRHGSLRS